MKWFIKIIKRLFKKNEIKLIEESKSVKDFKNSQNNFVFNLKRNADLERDDGNGYKIIPHINLKDMI